VSEAPMNSSNEAVVCLDGITVLDGFLRPNLDNQLLEFLCDPVSFETTAIHNMSINDNKQRE